MGGEGEEGEEGEEIGGERRVKWSGKREKH